MEEHRRYTEEPEPDWYAGPGQYSTSDQSPYDSGVHERPGGAFRLPEQRDGQYARRDEEYARPEGGHGQPDGDFARRDEEYAQRDGGHGQRDGDFALRDEGYAQRDAAYGHRDGEFAPRNDEYGHRESEYATLSPYASPDPAATVTGSHARSASAEPASTAPESVRIPVRGPEYPTIRPTGSASPADTSPATAYAGGSSTPTSGSPAPGLRTAAALNEPTGSVPPILGFAPEHKPSDSVYRTRRPVAPVLVAVGTVLLLVPAVFLLLRATFVDDPAARGIVPAVLLTLGLPLAGLGLYALAGGGPVGRDAWLRPPVVYLPIGLVLLLAAGLAVA